MLGVLEQEQKTERAIPFFFCTHHSLSHHVCVRIIFVMNTMQNSPSIPKDFIRLSRPGHWIKNLQAYVATSYIPEFIFDRMEL
jgi:hypothetical protein